MSFGFPKRYIPYPCYCKQREQHSSCTSLVIGVSVVAPQKPDTNSSPHSPPQNCGIWKTSLVVAMWETLGNPQRGRVLFDGENEL
eukprot:2725063-Amphidinium_carterae.1